ncbi:GspH/FimT family pseudopilin [Herbaspirillum sp. alder98]|uniref:GspH/FimT family pseudopilin n=1 Tax=Herbaspirillum sp. alder98 TaxID=2913096 RepID=UPI001CD8ED74|nr:GspH/FimT family pseudopilin [Herbaspirillum sp. alder98]MCA1324870.1 GspH/FimT family pseudopilin [Herbaspirillum sp. alder98]
MHTQRSRPGFTLIETMVVLLIAAIVLTAGLPLLQSMVSRQRVVAAANDFFHAAHLTRTTALRQGHHAAMHPTDRNDWRQGWQILVDNRLVMTHPALDAGIEVTYNNNGEKVAYHADGRPDGPSTWFFSSGDTERRVIINFLGRIRICDPARRASC